MSKLFEEMTQGLKEAEAFLAGRSEGYRVTLPVEIDVRLIRKRLGMTQEAFSRTFGFSLDAVKHWEGGRRTPEAAARAFLTVIARDPVAVMTALDSALHEAEARPLSRRRTRTGATSSSENSGGLKRTA